jgi:hypothetical protein
MPAIDGTTGSTPVLAQPQSTTLPPSADLDGNGLLDPYEQQQAAIAFAPVLYFAPDEENFPADPMTFIEQSSLREEVDFWGDNELHGEGDVPPEELTEIGPDNADADSQVFLDHSDDARAGDIADAPMLYQYDPQTNTITYHVFYAYNDGPPGLGDVQNHEGDWERITIQLDGQFRPTEVRYSAHGGLDVSRAWPGADNPSGQPLAPLENGKPVVYVGQGSHANFPQTGEWETQADGIYDLAAYDPERSVRLDLGTLEARDVTAEPWYGTHVMWGERGSMQEFGVGETSGPTAPVPDGDDADLIPDKGPIVEADPREPVTQTHAPWWLPQPTGPMMPR